MAINPSGFADFAVEVSEWVGFNIPTNSLRFIHIHCTQHTVWLERVARGLDLQLNRSQVQIPAAALLTATLGKLFTHVLLSPSSIIWYWHKPGS